MKMCPGALPKACWKGTDSPSSPANGHRAMAVTVLYRLDGSPGVSRASFSDVAEDAWYAAPCAWARENGIAQGDEAGLFHPEAR